MIQQENPFGFSLLETSLGYVRNLGFLPKHRRFELWRLGAQQNSLSSSSITEQQSRSTQKLSSLPPRGGSSQDVPSRKRTRRTRSGGKMEDKERQRMNHIAVERNRRRQMNHFLSVLKYMMPPSYSQLNDQASIIEGTISYLKKLEQLLHSLQAQLKATRTSQSPKIFSNFFIFPQYSTAIAAASSSSHHHHHHMRLPAVADVEVAMVERHAIIKVLTKTRPRLLFNILNEFYSLGLSILHLNLTTSKDMSLFTFSVKVEADCQLSPSTNEVANTVHEVVRRINKES